MTTSAKNWKDAFGAYLRLVLDTYLIKTAVVAEDCHVHPATVRSWKRGDRVPDEDAIKALLKRLQQEVRPSALDGAIVAHVKSDFNAVDNLTAYQQLCYCEHDLTTFVCLALQYYFHLARHGKLPVLDSVSPEPRGRTLAAVFDFAGTLVGGLEGDSTWWHLCREVGIDESGLSREREYSSNARDRAAYISDVTRVLGDAGLTRAKVLEIGSSLVPARGARELFERLHDLNVRICIVSRSERDIIKSSLKDLMSYVDEVQSNAFEYSLDEKGVVEGIVVTDFDYEGKAAYVARLAADMHASCEDIVFVGNSDNDVFVRRTGAKTFCVNPRNTDGSDTSSWSKSFIRLESLDELLPYITQQNVTELLH